MSGRYQPAPAPASRHTARSRRNRTGSTSWKFPGRLMPVATRMASTSPAYEPALSGVTPEATASAWSAHPARNASILERAADRLVAAPEEVTASMCRSRAWMTGSTAGSTNVLFNSTLTDMETCYKMFRREVIEGMTIRSEGFDVEPEITAKILKQKKWRIHEIAISYHGRTYDEGKKITWRAGVRALWSLVRYRIMD